MEITNARPTIEPAARECELLAWSIHMARRDPYRLLPILGSASFAAVTAWILFRNPVFSVAALFMIASATAEYWLPASCRLTDRGAHCQCGANRMFIEWTKVKRALLYDDGVRLSPLPAASRLDAFRGVYLRFAPDGQPGDRESTLAIVTEYRASKRPETEA